MTADDRPLCVVCKKWLAAKGRKICSADACRHVWAARPGARRAPRAPLIDLHGTPAEQPDRQDRITLYCLLASARLPLVWSGEGGVE